MKTSILSLNLLLLFYCLASPLLSSATNYTNSGSNTSYNLYSGDTLRITNGTYQSNITTFNTGAVIIVTATATFKPNYVNSPAGKIINYGTCQFGHTGTQGGFKFENFNQLTVNGDLSLYDGALQTWTNNITARMDISGSFYMNNTTFINYASINVGGNFSLYTTTSNLSNKGLITIAGDFAISNGILNNENRIIADDFYAWGGQVINEGSISPKGGMTFNSGTTYTNKCLLITNAGFTNYGNFQNNGLLWVGRNGTAADHFYNSGTFTNSSTAVVKTVKLTNYNTLAGGGSYYINGDSYTSGTVGKSGATTDSIRIYDVTRTSSSAIFDVQYGTVNPNVVFRTVALPDTNNVTYTGCSIYYKSDLGTLLPIEWNYFDARLMQGKPVLNWGTQFEAGMKFEVERSYDNVSFSVVNAVISNNTKTYSYTDGGLTKNTIVYYRVKATSAVNGAIKYTETKTIKNSTALTASLCVYPNPVKDGATLSYQSEVREQINIRVRNISGQQVFAKSIIAAAGANYISLSETASLKNGAYIIEVLNAEEILTSVRIIKQ